MTQLISFFKNRRVWSALVALIMFVLTKQGIDNSIVPEELTDLFTSAGESIATLMIVGLNIWSLFKPKNLKK